METYVKEYKFADNYMQFINKIMKCIIEKDKNTFISPISIYVLLAMLEFAAAGDTRNEISELIREKGYDAELFLADMNKLLATVKKSKKAMFRNANALAISEAYKESMVDEFIKVLKSAFDAEVFADKDIITKINNWVAEKTNGMIKNFLAPGTALDFALINAVAFETDWKEKYSEYNILFDEIFTNSKGEEETVVMLTSEEEYAVQGDSFVGFTRPYKGEEYEFMAILPDGEINDFIDAGFMGKISEIYRNRKEKEVYADIPEFVFETTYQLNDSLNSLGVNKIFSPAADMSPAICIPGSHVDSILHKAKIQVDRNGTKAAGVSGAVVVAGCCPDFENLPLSVTLDRPFIFAIMHKETTLPIFVGVVNSINGIDEE